jgi:hypothetical protein
MNFLQEPDSVRLEKVQLNVFDWSDLTIFETE